MSKTGSDNVKTLPQLRLEVSDEALILERLDNGWTIARADAAKGRLDLHVTCEDPDDSVEAAGVSLANALAEALSPEVMEALADALVGEEE